MAKYLTRCLVIDVESTCWDKVPPKGEVSEIIEIGVCPVDISEGRIESPIRLLVKPEYSKVSEFCNNLTGLRQDQLAWMGMSFGAACGVLRNGFESDKLFMASWGDYDREMFHKMCELHGEKYPFGKTHLNIKHLFGLSIGARKTLGLMEAVKKTGREFSGKQHSAADDAYNAAVVLMHIINAFRKE